MEGGGSASFLENSVVLKLLRWLDVGYYLTMITLRNEKALCPFGSDSLGLKRRFQNA